MKIIQKIKKKKKICVLYFNYNKEIKLLKIK